MFLFFDFFMTAPYRTPTSETIVGRRPSNNALKKYGLALDVPTKVEKTLDDSSGGIGRLRRSGSALGGSEHWAYLIVETQDMCLVESQDICLVETQDMCCVES